MRFSVKYIPTALFSLKDSNATNSGAKALFLPSPYAIKMAILNQAIATGGDLQNLKEKRSLYFSYIRDAQINFFIEADSYFTVNNSFVKILKPAREGGGYGQTVAFREYLQLSKPIEIIFENQKPAQKEYLQKYLHKINYFGKRGCFFQFLEYSDEPSKPNVYEFSNNISSPGILQEFDDFGEKVNFENVNNYTSNTTNRKKLLLVLPLNKKSSSKSFSVYKSYNYAPPGKNKP